MYTISANAKRTATIGVATLAALLIASGCSTADTSASPGSAAPTATASSAAPSATAQDQAHNAADVMFAEHMIPHHQQAVEMSDMLLGKEGVDPRVTALATQIKAAQGPEIAQMQSWLKQWGVPEMPMMSGTPTDHGGMGGGGMGPGGMGNGGMPGMQGMMSNEDMAALSNATGADATRLFLTQMIEHHEGAITMANAEIGDGQYPPAIAMSHAIVTGQQKEIDTMNQILGTL